MLLAGAVMDALLGLGDWKKVGVADSGWESVALSLPPFAPRSIREPRARTMRCAGTGARKTGASGVLVTAKDEAISMATSYGDIETNDDDVDILGLSAGIVAAYVAQNTVARSVVPELIRSVHGALAALGGSEIERPAERGKPAVPVSRSVQRDHIVCLEDGKKLKMLKRYLRTHYDMSPEEYRRKWSLPGDYPMVAPAYAERRSDFAKSIGLGKGKMRGR
jgi:predicted transcriptional regulator